MMNRKFLHIILIAIVLYSCAGESKDENTLAIPTESAKKADDLGGGEIFTELEKDNEALTTEQLEALQVRAIQKFQDFTDYIKIISDNDVDDNLKNHSVQLALDLFINDTITISSSDIYENLDTNASTTISLAKFVNTLAHSSGLQIFITIKTSKFINPLRINSFNKYSGMIESTFLVNGKETSKKIDVQLIEIQKEFGENSQSIMEVRLGNIY